MTYDETVATQPQRMRITEMVIKRLTEGGDPDCAIIFSGSPLAKAGVTHLAGPNGEIELIPDPCCPPGYEYVGLNDELVPKPKDHVHTQACVVTCRRYDGTTEAKDPAPATLFEPTCPASGGGMRCALPAGHSSWHANPNLTWSDPDPAPATKPSHKERARALRQILSSGEIRSWDLAEVMFASAFAEVEAEARAEAVRGQHPRRCRQTCGTHTHLVTSQLSEPKAEEAGLKLFPPSSGLPATPAGRLEMVQELLAPVDEDGNPCEPLISREDALKMLGEAGLVYGRTSLPWMRAMIASTAKPTCTCGASATGTLPHSRWCDAA